LYKFVVAYDIPTLIITKSEDKEDLTIRISEIKTTTTNNKKESKKETKDYVILFYLESLFEMNQWNKFLNQAKDKMNARNNNHS
jgi:hypothetical protein